MKWPWKKKRPPSVPPEKSKEHVVSLREDTIETRTHRLSKLPAEELDGVFQTLVGEVDQHTEEAKELAQEAKQAKREAKRIVTKTSGFKLTPEQQAEIDAAFAKRDADLES